MVNTVYLIGAGINRAIQNKDGLSPPLVSDFFKISQSGKFATTFEKERFKEVYNYIEKYWKRDRKSLISAPFDLEECFSLIELHLKESTNSEERRKLYLIYHSLKTLLGEILYDFSSFTNVDDMFTPNAMRTFGQILFNKQPVIITFNYDLFIENILETASGANKDHIDKFMEWYGKQDGFVNEVPDEMAGICMDNWNRILAYEVDFDEFAPKVLGGTTIYRNGKKFYQAQNNHAYYLPILKLHGSLNWFRYVNVRVYPTISEEEPKFREENWYKILHKEEHWFNNSIHEQDGWLLDPILIPPVANKDDYLGNELYKRVFSNLWNKAKEALSSCKTLVVIGYSFPPTDFRTRKLFLDAFADHSIEELVVVNPDTSVVQKVKNLCHFEKPVVVCQDLEEYVKMETSQSKLPR